MSDPRTTDFDATFAAYEAKCAREAQLKAEILPHNKQVLFAALATAGIALVTIEFDGCGDSGQFEQADAYDAENRVRPMPEARLSIKDVDYTAGTIIDIEITPDDYLQQLACDLLEETHPGWENDDGAQGEFRFSVEQRTITLEYNERYTASHYHEHHF